MTDADWHWPQTLLVIQIESPSAGNDVVNQLAIQDCLKISNRVITSYQAATTDWQNSGLISVLGTAYLQLNAEILVDGESVRDRWPSPSFFSIPLNDQETKKFQDLLGGAPLPLDELFHTHSFVSLEREDYSISVINNAAAVEIRLTEEVLFS